MLQVNIFTFNGVEYIGLESRKQDYDRDKAAGTNFVEKKIKEGLYDRKQRGKSDVRTVSASVGTIGAAPAAVAAAKDRTHSKAAGSASITDDFPKRVLCIRRGFGGRESFRFTLIKRIMDRVRNGMASKLPRTHSCLINKIAPPFISRLVEWCTCHQLTQATRATKR